MVNTSEPAIKIVIHRQAEMANTLEPKGNGDGQRGLAVCSRDPSDPPVNRRNVETPYRSLRGQQTARSVFGGAGLGCRKKRRPDGNGPDTGCNITWHESEPTSDGSYLAREFVES